MSTTGSFVIQGFTRLHNSVNGNSRWAMTTEHGVRFESKADSMVGFDIENLAARMYSYTAEGMPVVLQFDARGKVEQIRLDDVCRMCGGVGSVPAMGGEEPELVDDGYVACPNCSSDQR